MRTDWSQVLLDLLNTTPVVDGDNTDVLATDGSARAWLSLRDGDDEDATNVRQLRDDLQKVVRGQLPAEVLNRYVADVRRVPKLHGDGLDWDLGLSADWRARVVLAWGELQTDRPGRLRPCANGECHLFLLDRSRGGTGRWCSMSGCGNRMKARRHYGKTTGRGDGRRSTRDAVCHYPE